MGVFEITHWGWNLAQNDNSLFIIDLVDGINNANVEKHLGSHYILIFLVMGSFGALVQSSTMLI